MTATVVYVYPVCAPQYEHYALRFLDSYHRFPPAVQHDTVVVLNGCRENAETQCLFASLPRLRFLEHDNSGYDIGAFQHAAQFLLCPRVGRTEARRVGFERFL